MEDSLHLAMHATSDCLPEEREIGAFKITVVATAPRSEASQREQVESLTRWLLASFNHQRKEASSVEP
jgi:hypothetical protein